MKKGKIIIRTQAKHYAKEQHQMRLGGDFLDELDQAVHRLIDKAIENAQKDKIGTVKERHLTLEK